MPCSQPFFLSMPLTYHLKFALTNIISKSLQETNTVRSFYAGFYVVFVMFHCKHWDIFKGFILSYWYVAGAICLCESPRSCVFGGHHKEEDSIRCLGDAVAGIVGCLSSCLDSNSGPHDEAVFYSLHCFSTLPLSKFLFSFSFSSL